MKKGLLTLAFLTAAIGGYAQSADSTSAEHPYNRWSIEAAGGVNKPFRAMSAGYRTETPNAFTVNLGGRYMFNPKFGLKLDLGYEKFQDASNSPEFETTYMSATLQGVFNVGRALKFEDFTKTFGLLMHGGPGYYRMTFDGTGADDSADQGFNVNGGITAQIKLGRSVAFNLGVNGTINFMQNRTFDGYEANAGFVDGMIVRAVGGFTFYLGSHETHADWYFEGDKMQEQLDALEQRVGDLETMMNDSDKDGVPDYLDAEPNTTAGVAVNSRGQAIDNNGNGVPDELESYLTKTYGDPNKSTINNSGYVPNNELIRNLINEGYVTTYFDFNKSTPTNVSSEGIDFILTYLRNNPNATVEIIGHADEIGRTAYNDKLSTRRAEAVKNILVKAKIDPARLKVVPAGEDRSVEAESAGARKLVRRVTFRVN